MRVVLIINSLLLFCLSLLSCNNIKEEIKVVKPLTFNSVFSNFGENKIEPNDIIWSKHFDDTTILFDISLQNISNKNLLIEVANIGGNIPFLLVYNPVHKNKKNEIEKINLNLIHQFNTIYMDSLIIVKNNNKLVVEEAYLIGFQKVGENSFLKLKIKNEKDTIKIFE